MTQDTSREEQGMTCKHCEARLIVLRNGVVSHGEPGTYLHFAERREELGR